MNVNSSAFAVIRRRQMASMHSLSSVESRIRDRYDQQVNAVTNLVETQISVGPNVLVIVKAVAALILFDLLQAYGISCSRRATCGFLAE